MLAGYGQLLTRTCEQCDSHEANGCGVPPDGWEAQCPDGDPPEHYYWLADCGHVHERCGWYWPWCPRWFLERAPVMTRKVADTVVRLAEQVRLAMPIPTGMVSCVEAQVRAALRMWAACDAQRIREEVRHASPA